MTTSNQTYGASSTETYGHTNKVQAAHMDSASTLEDIVKKLHRLSTKVDNFETEVTSLKQHSRDQNSSRCMNNFRGYGRTNYIDSNRPNQSFVSRLKIHKTKIKEMFVTCKGDVERTIEKADQQPRLAGLLRQSLHEDSTLGLGCENSTNVTEMLDGLENDGMIGPQKYSYFSKIMHKLDPRLGKRVDQAQKELQKLQKALLQALKNFLQEMDKKINEQGNESCCTCKRKRENEEEGTNHKRHESNGKEDH